MKLLIKIFSVFLIPTLLWAAQEEAELHEGPCNKILESCKEYVKTSKQKKSLYRDCMQPLLNDEKIAGIKVDETILKACKAKKSELKLKK